MCRKSKKIWDRLGEENDLIINPQGPSVEPLKSETLHSEARAIEKRKYNCKNNKQYLCFHHCFSCFGIDKASTLAANQPFHLPTHPHLVISNSGSQAP